MSMESYFLPVSLFLIAQLVSRIANLPFVNNICGSAEWKTMANVQVLVIQQHISQLFQLTLEVCPKKQLFSFMHFKSEDSLKKTYSWSCKTGDVVNKKAVFSFISHCCLNNALLLVFDFVLWILFTGFTSMINCYMSLIRGHRVYDGLLKDW